MQLENQRAFASTSLAKQQHSNNGVDKPARNARIARQPNTANKEVRWVSA
ncbi:MAG: hypothetical protein ABSE82_14615 [Nitrososphaerales archaeon]